MREWIATGTQLGALEDQRAAVQKSSPTAADALKARNRWIRTMNAMFSLIDLIDEPGEAVMAVELRTPPDDLAPAPHHESDAMSSLDVPFSNCANHRTPDRRESISIVFPFATNRHADLPIDDVMTMGRRSIGNLVGLCVENRSDVRDKLVHWVASIPIEELLPILDKRRAKNADPANEELDVQTTLVSRLAESALSTRDKGLTARRLDKSTALLGSNADAIAALARGGGGEARVEAPTREFVLSVRSQETRKRSADVARGIAFGLGLPGSDARLASRDDHGRVEGIQDALESLVSDGDKGTVDMGLEESFECQQLPPSWRGIGGVVAYGSCVSDVLLAVSGTSVQTAVGLDLDGALCVECKPLA